MYEENERAIFCQKASRKLVKDMLSISLKVTTSGDSTSFEAKISNYGVLRVECKETPFAEFELSANLFLRAESMPLFAEAMEVLANYLKWVRGDPHIL